MPRLRRWISPAAQLFPGPPFQQDAAPEGRALSQGQPQPPVCSPGAASSSPAIPRSARTQPHRARQSSAVIVSCIPRCGESRGSPACQPCSEGRLVTQRTLNQAGLLLPLAGISLAQVSDRWHRLQNSTGSQAGQSIHPSSDMNWIQVRIKSREGLCSLSLTRSKF